MKFYTCIVTTVKDFQSAKTNKILFFLFQMPVPRNSMQLDYSRWQQNLIGVLQVDIAYHKQIEIGSAFVAVGIFINFD